MNMKQWAEAIIASDKRVAIPIMTHPGIDIIKKNVIDAVRDGEIHARAVIALSQKYTAAAASTVIMDLTVEAEAFGAEIVMPDDEVPSVIGRLVSSYAEVEALKVPDITAARVPEYLKANQLVAQQITKPTFGGAIGPFSLAGRLYDMTEIMMAIYIDTDTIRLLLEKCTEFAIKYIKAIKATGVAGVIIAEPAAGLLPNEDAIEFSSKYISRIVAEVQDENFLVVLHNCGNTGHCTESMVITGAKGLHFGNKIDIVEALRQTPSDRLVMGNLDPVSVFKQSTPTELEAEARRVLAATAGYRNFVLSSGCDTPPGVPVANIVAFYAALD